MRQVIEGLRTLAVLAIALLMSACTTTHPLNVDSSQVHDLGPDEGIVFGSLRVEIAQEGGGFGRRAAGFSYRLTISGPEPWKSEIPTPSGIVREVLQNTFTEEWDLLVSPGEDRTFVARLPSGYQNVGVLRPTSKSLWAGGEFNIQARFRVEGRSVTYIGRLVLVLPERLNAFSPAAHVRVEDSLARDQVALGGDYGELFDSPRVELINVTSDRAIYVPDPPPPVP